MEKIVQDVMVRWWYITFGPDHINPITGRSLARNYVKLYGDEDDVRGEIHRRFGPRWSMCHPQADTLPVPEGDEFPWLYRGAGVERFGLRELVLENVEKFREPVSDDSEPETEQHSTETTNPS